MVGLASRFLAVMGWLVMAGCASEPLLGPEAVPGTSRRIIFCHGAVLTMDPAASMATGIAIMGEKIVAVGTDDDVLSLATPDDVVVDLAGATLMPGFVDAHSHLFNDARFVLDISLIEAQQIGLENGITTLGDLYIDEGFLPHFLEFNWNHLLKIRTSLFLAAMDNCGQSKGGWWRTYAQSDEPGEVLRFGGIKMFADGGTCGRPALSYERVPGEGTGDLFFSQEELDQLVAEANAAGRQVAIHALGDRAVEQAQNAIAAALEGGANSLRHRIEHNAVIRPELLGRYREIGIVPVVLGYYPTCNDSRSKPPEDYQAWEWPWRELLDANPGWPMAWHSDDPYFGRVRPLDDLYNLVTRNGLAVDGTVCAAPNWQKTHVVTVEEALRMMTIDAAYALFREDEVGSLEPGKYADLIILSKNPLQVDPAGIPETAVWMTMIGGRVVYCASGKDAMCP